MDAEPEATADPSPGPENAPREEGDELAGILTGLEAALRESAELRSLAGRLAQWLGRTLETIEGQRRPAPAKETAEATAVTIELEEKQLHLGGAHAVVEVSGTDDDVPRPPARVPRPIEVAPETDDEPPPLVIRVDVGLLVRRARLQAECCRWAIQRRRRLQAGDTFEDAINPRDKDLERLARELDTFAWPLDPYASLPADPDLEDLACCYENVIAGVELAREVRHDEELGSEFLGDAYLLLAEAQSALRCGLRQLADVNRDDVQVDTFLWLRRRTSWDHIYVARYMHLGDAANPAAWHDLQQKIESLRNEWEERGQSTRQRKNLFGKVRYHVRRVEQMGANGDPSEDWNRIDAAVGGLLDGGLPPSNVELRDLLLPVLGRLDGSFEVGEGFQRVLDAVDAFLATREVEGGKEHQEREPSAEVKQVAGRLRGRTVVLIGGHVRPKSREALEKSFELQALHWISRPGGTSYSSFEPAIARPETALVLLAIRWSSHSFENVKELCRRHDKLFVRLPAGYNPNQVARQVLEQVGDRLST